MLTRKRMFKALGFPRVATAHFYLYHQSLVKLFKFYHPGQKHTLPLMKIRISAFVLLSTNDSVQKINSDSPRLPFINPGVEPVQHHQAKASRQLIAELPYRDKQPISFTATGSLE